MVVAAATDKEYNICSQGVIVTRISTIFKQSTTIFIIYQQILIPIYVKFQTVLLKRHAIALSFVRIR